MIVAGLFGISPRGSKPKAVEEPAAAVAGCCLARGDAPMTAQDLPDSADRLADQAERVLRLASERSLMIATAESCTGGLVASLLTDIEGRSGCFERGFVTYSEDAKSELLGIPAELIERHGAVSAQVAAAMVVGALSHSGAGVACSITGFAGKGEDEDDEAGLVYVAAARGDDEPLIREFHFGDLGREGVRHRAAAAALDLLERVISE
jgi:nicotinamide-nucleotide amidase